MAFHDGAETNLDDYDRVTNSFLPQMAQAINLLYIPSYAFHLQVLLIHLEISPHPFPTNLPQMAPNHHQSEISHLLEILYRNQINYNVSYLH